MRRNPNLSPRNGHRRRRFLVHPAQKRCVRRGSEFCVSLERQANRFLPTTRGMRAAFSTIQPPSPGWGTIYGTDLETYDWDDGYVTDIRPLAHAIVGEDDPPDPGEPWDHRNVPYGSVARPQRTIAQPGSAAVMPILRGFSGEPKASTCPRCRRRSCLCRAMGSRWSHTRRVWTRRVSKLHSKPPTSSRILRTR